MRMCVFVYFLKRECKQTELLRNLKPPGGSDHTVGNSKTPFIYWMPAVSHYGLSAERRNASSCQSLGASNTLKAE